MKEAHITLEEAQECIRQMSGPDSHWVKSAATAHKVSAWRYVMCYTNEMVTIVPDRATDRLFILRIE